MDPFSFVIGVIDHGGFPFAVHLVIPILGLGGVGIVNLGTIIPIFGFFGLGILDFLWWQDVPVIFKRSFLCTFVVNENFIGAIRVNDQSVQMSENVVLASDFFGD